MNRAVTAADLERLAFLRAQREGLVRGAERLLALASAVLPMPGEGAPNPDAFPVLADAVMEEPAFAASALALDLERPIADARALAPRILCVRVRDANGARVEQMTDAEVVRALLDGTLRRRVRERKDALSVELPMSAYDAVVALERDFAAAMRVWCMHLLELGKP